MVAVEEEAVVEEEVEEVRVAAESSFETFPCAKGRERLRVEEVAAVAAVVEEEAEEVEAFPTASERVYYQAVLRAA